MSTTHEVKVSSIWFDEGKMAYRIVILAWYDKNGNIFQFSTNEESKEHAYPRDTPNFYWGHYFPCKKIGNR